MTDLPYNGQTALVRKMEDLLGQKKLSTAAAMRLLLEKELEDIKRNHERDERINKIEQDLQYSIGLWTNRNPKKAVSLFLFFWLFSVSEIREPVILWITSNIKLLMGIL